jgi:hypothetical protein
MTFDKLYGSIGEINTKYIDVTPYSFKDITIGLPVNEAITKLKSHNYDIEFIPKVEFDHKLTAQIKLNNFSFGTEKVYVDFIGDYDNKISAYHIIKSSSIGDIDNDWISLYLEMFSNVFKK